MSKKNLQYYLQNPDEMPTDPKVLEQLANDQVRDAIEGNEDQLTVDRFVASDPVAKDERTGESSDAEPKPGEKTVAEETAAEVKADDKPVDTEKPAGILAKDGKNVIPYSQLESARQRALAAEQLAQSQAEELERLRAAKDTDSNVNADVQMLSDDDLNALAQDSPTLAKVMRAQQNMIQKLTGTVEELASEQGRQIANETSTVKSEIQSAIDATPLLAEWQTAEDQTLWNEASRFDKLLRESPRYANVPFEERFAKVVELTQTALGLEREEEIQAKPELTQSQIRAAAEAKMKKAVPLPKTLSDIPGGAPPAVDEKDRLEQMSSVELGQKFLGMTPDQMQAYLNAL